ncbi:hypothetical protein AB0K09_29495 [Streptomyces sp. NPDC049577]|uniref:hypothetical protein n=1 Tax=Streptomyces sp. NPDC049577 TaxID=3155153 RepID=UPI00341AA447
MRSSYRRRVVTGTALAVALAATGVGLGAPPALADTVSVSYACTGPGAPGDPQSLEISMTAPATVQQGGTAELTVDVTTALTSPIDLPAHTVTGDMTINLGGAGSGSVTATGFGNPDPVPTGSTVTLTGGTASARLDTPGTTTFSPGDAAVHVFGLTVQCTISGDTQAAATTEVTPGTP